MQIDTLVFQGTPQPLDEYVIEEPALAIYCRQVICKITERHRDADARPLQSIRPNEGRELDRAFDADEDISAAVDWSAAERPNLTARRVNVDFPTWMVEGLDARAAHLGITRQALIKIWIAEQLG